MRVAVEVCVTSVEEALAAERAGVDTIEVCCWLSCGGITPSFGLLNLLQERVKLRKRVLVRPRPGGFVYGAEDRQVLLRDVMMSGVGDKDCGIVSGGLNELGLPDPELVKGVIMAAAGREVTFHRAIDVSSDIPRAFEVLLGLAVPRVLTSGGADTALEAASVIAGMVRRGGDAVIVAAAAGINGANVVEVVERTGVREVHFSAQKPSTRGPHDSVPDTRKIDGVLNALAKAGLR